MKPHKEKECLVMTKMIKLTDAQRDFAADNHDLLLQYLRVKGLSEDEFYDIAVFGYLKAVQIYNQQPELQAYSFKTIAYKRMYAAIWNYFRSLRAAKRNAEVLSLDYSDAGGVRLSEQVASDTPAVYEYAEIREKWDSVKSAATKKQMRVVELRAQGYTGREIGNVYSLSPGAVSGRIHRLRKNTARLAA